MKTTREAAREASHNDLVHNLTDLLEKNYDAEKGYKKAIEHSNNPHLKQFLKDQAVQRNHFATELDKQLHLLNEHPGEKGSAMGAMHRFWMNFKTTFTKNDDEAILEECLRGEKASLKEYDAKLKNKFLPTEISEMFKGHRSRISQTVDTIRLLEDLEA
ncbi:ferritin-like domain-containing protein [Christiangramia aquimixticola]|uniref:ferritin-like domain-containing protein n=1 Tax=Christiangramia aquimixticola TaxID=1697558 RepID=UPI003AA9D506